MLLIPFPCHTNDEHVFAIYYCFIANQKVQWKWKKKKTLPMERKKLSSMRKRNGRQTDFLFSYLSKAIKKLFTILKWVSRTVFHPESEPHDSIIQSPRMLHSYFNRFPISNKHSKQQAIVQFHLNLNRWKLDIKKRTSTPHIFKIFRCDKMPAI